MASRVVALAVLCASALPSPAQMTGEQIASFRQKVAAKGDSSTPEIHAIEAALRDHDPKTALRLSDAVVGAPALSDESPQFNAWIKSLGYLYRGMATDVSKDAARAVADIERSAALGNLEALRLLMTNFLKTPDQSAFRGYRPADDEVRRYFLIAADLADHMALNALAEGKVPGVSDVERTYWSILAQVFPSPVPQIGDLVKLSTEAGARLNSAAARYGLAGAPFETGTPSLPGRDFIATLGADFSLRGVLARSLGRRSPRTQTDGSDATTLMEQFLYESTMTSRTGLADIYLLVPGRRTSQEKNIRYLEREAVVSEMRPGDRIWVSCRSMSHTATVFRVDPAADTLSLVDPAYEFWLPGVNTCVKSFKHEPYKYGFYFQILKLSEIKPMIDAIGTYRTAEAIGLSGFVPEALPPAVALPPLKGVRERPPKRAPFGLQRALWDCQAGLPDKFVGGPESALAQSDLMTLFNFVKLRTEPRAGGARLEIYKPGTSDMYGQAGLIATFDGRSCVHSLSLTLRRSFFEEEETHLHARVLFERFMRGVAAPANDRLALDVLTGKAPVYDGGASGDHVRMENITASNGAPLLRITVW